MTVLALKVSRAANGVSELHGEVSRRNVASRFIRTLPEDKVPIGHITNGIHLLGWMKGTVRQILAAKIDEMATAGMSPEFTETAQFGGTATGLGGDQFLRILAKDARPEFRFRRGNLGAALQTAPRID